MGQQGRRRRRKEGRRDGEEGLRGGEEGRQGRGESGRGRKKGHQGRREGRRGGRESLQGRFGEDCGRIGVRGNRTGGGGITLSWSDEFVPLRRLDRPKPSSHDFISPSSLFFFSKKKKLTTEPMISKPNRDRTRFKFRHHRTLSYRISSMGLTFRRKASWTDNSNGRLSKSARGLKGSGRTAPIIHAIR